MTLSRKPLVVIVDPDAALRELNREILEEAGYRVETPSKDAEVLAFIESRHPQAVVIDIRYEASPDFDLVAALQSNPKTRDIPVVAISTAARLAAKANAFPVTSAAVVAPYDIAQLETAVAKALNSPPPSAVLPPPVHPPSSAVSFATEELSKRAQGIVLHTIRDLHGVEPYKSRFAELTPGLVDNLGKMLEAINQGLRRSLPPAEVFAVPEIESSIEEHVQLRKRQGVDTAATIEEYQLLTHNLRQFFFSLAGQDSFTQQDAFHMDGQVLRYVDELIRKVIRLYNATDGANNNPPM